MRRIFPFVLAATLLLYPAVCALGADAPPVTRGEFVVALWQLWGGVPFEDTRCFSDVGHDEPYTVAVCWAQSLGLVNGTGCGCFSPSRAITREEAAVLLRRAANYLGRDTSTVSNLAQCNDYADISPWADDSLYWATECGLIDWAPGGLRAPLGMLSPAETADIFRRF